MTSLHLHQSVHAALTLLQQARANAGLKELDLADSPMLRRDARRFAMHLANVTDVTGATLAILEDHAGAESFWSLVRSHWEEMESFLLPSAFEFLPEPRPFEILCRCETWFDQMVPIDGGELTTSRAAPLAESDARELEWDHHFSTAEMPGIPRPVREALRSPLLDAMSEDMDHRVALNL